MDSRLHSTDCFISATSYEVLSLYRECEELGYTWEQDQSVLIEEVGIFCGEPLRIQFNFNTIKGVRIAFYEMDGQLFHRAITEKWIEDNFPLAKHYDAMNFHLAFRSVSHKRG